MDKRTWPHGQPYLVCGRHEAHDIDVVAEGTNTIEFQRLKDGSKDPPYGQSSPNLRSRGSISKSGLSVAAEVLIAASTKKG